MQRALYAAAFVLFSFNPVLAEVRIEASSASTLFWPRSGSKPALEAKRRSLWSSLRCCVKPANESLSTALAIRPALLS
jgi:hypothetical protein